MKRLLALAPAALLVLAGCGDTCSSKPAAVDPQGQCSAVAAGSQVTFNLQLCPTCSETAPSCTAELRPGNVIELDSVVQTCQEQAGCTITGCNISQTACALSQPLTAGQTYTVQFTGAGGLQSATVTAQSGGSSSCTL